MICPNCKHSCSNDSVFCDICIWPLKVTSYQDFTSSELLLSFTGLISSLSELIPTLSDPKLISKTLISYYSMFWLRPESAILQALEAECAAPFLITPENKKILELGCGNGLHSSLMMQWEFNESDDAYQNLNINSEDMFASPLQNDLYFNPVKKGGEIDYGIDLKFDSIMRSNKTPVFKETINADARHLPIPHNSITHIYSNLLRDFPDNILHQTLDELKRILTEKGKLIFIAPTENYKKSLYFFPQTLLPTHSKNEELHKKSFQKLDRGRSVFCQQQHSIDTWKNILTTHGLKITHYKDFCNANILRFWDTGLRPFLPLILPKINQLTLKEKIQLKSSLVSFYLKTTSQAFVDDLTTKENKAFRLIIAEPIN